MVRIPAPLPGPVEVAVEREGRGPLRRRLFAVALALSSAALVVFVPPAPAVHASGVAIRGDYARPLLTPNGDVDIAATVSRLASAHVNTYAYLICRGPRSGQHWRTLPAFLTAAAEENINVWVYLCPPGESSSNGQPDIQPYGWDYPAWAVHIAELSRAHPNLTAYAIDDFGRNTGVFTRAYVEQMVAAGRAVNPGIRFLPVLYYPELVGYPNVVGGYRYYIDGVIFPYRNDSAGTDTVNPGNVEPETRAVRAAIGCAGGARCAQLFFPPDTPSYPGWSVSYYQTATVDPVAASYGLSLQVWDDFTGPTTGYRYVRILIDDTVVWSRDVAGVEADTGVTVPPPALAAALAGKRTATLRLEMYDAQPLTNFHTAVTFDNLSTTGFRVANPDFEGSADSSWLGARSSPAHVFGYARNLAPVVMTYAERLSSEPGIPTPEYVGAVVRSALDLTADGVAAGSMTYSLNLSGSDLPTASLAGCYDVVADSYAVRRPHHRLIGADRGSR